MTEWVITDKMLYWLSGFFLGISFTGATILLRKAVRRNTLESVVTGLVQTDYMQAAERLRRAREYLRSKGRLDLDTWELLDDRMSDCLDAWQAERASSSEGER